MTMQEKFQIVEPYREEGATADDKWATFESQRITSGNPLPGDGEKFNEMPCINLCDRREDWKSGFGGNTDVSDHVNPKSLVAGFAREDMGGADDQYSGEHIDLFYGEVLDEKGQEGFCERNNYLDRA